MYHGVQVCCSGVAYTVLAIDLRPFGQTQAVLMAALMDHARQLAGLNCSK
jgi:hypothetical protein